MIRLVFGVWCLVFGVWSPESGVRSWVFGLFSLLVVVGCL